MATTNKDLAQPIVNSTNWDVPINANTAVIDAALGGNTTKNVTGVGITPVVLTASEYQKLVLTFSGTLTANVTYHIPSGVGGQWIVRNATSGAFTVTIGNVAAGTSFVAPQGFVRTVYSDGTNIRAADEVVSSIPNDTVAYSSGGILTGSANMTYDGSEFNLDGTANVTTLGVSGNASASSLGVGAAASGTAGEIRATNNITAYYSDDRLKTRLGGIDDAIGKIMSLSGFYYEANKTAQALGYEVKKEVGVSAQQVQAVMPEVVAPAPIDEKYLTVRYERLVPLLIEAIKAQQLRIEELSRVPVSMSFPQFIIGLVAEEWITEEEGQMWLAGTLPPRVVSTISLAPAEKRFAATAKAMRSPVVNRLDPLVQMMALVQKRSAVEVDKFFKTYASA
jgi:hypothetical protein